MIFTFYMYLYSIYIIGGGMGGGMGPWPHLKFEGGGQHILWPHLNFGQILTKIDLTLMNNLGI